MNAKNSNAEKAGSTARKSPPIFKTTIKNDYNMDILETNILNLPLESLVPNEGQIVIDGESIPANPRYITEDEYAALKNSIASDNLTGINPLKVFEYNGAYVVLGGNMRLRALRELGIANVNCIAVPSTASADVLRKEVIIDNATFGKWDMDMLSNEWNEGKLREWGVELPSCDIEDDVENSAQEDDFDEDTDVVETRCKKGDVWQLGDHRLMCGDSTSENDMAVIMDGAKADIAFTSPPYNAGAIEQDGNKSTQKKYKDFKDTMTHDDYFKFISTNVRLLLENSCEVFYNIGLVAGNKIEIFRLINEYSSKFKDMIYWEKIKAAPCIQNGVVNNIVEFIICFGENNTRKFQNAQFKQGTYWNVIKGNNATSNEYSNIHKATFPIYLPENIVSNFSSKGSVVLDCFGGTGTTLIACEQLGRKCYMMELNPHYCDVIIARWEKLTGKTAVKL